MLSERNIGEGGYDPEPGTEMVSQKTKLQSAPSAATQQRLQDENHQNQNQNQNQNKKGETDLPPAYLSYLNELRSVWKDLPDLTITYKDLAYSVQVPIKRNEIPNLYTSYRDMFSSSFNFFRRRDTSSHHHRDTTTTKEFRPLNTSNGIIRPGELTLILAPPGHGKSVLLKSLAGRLERENENLRGEIRWNGLTSKQSKEQGQELSKLATFVEQGDVHFPMMTVRETFEFALRNSNAESKLLGSTIFDDMQKTKVELMLELLGLKECADTIVGNNMIRGVSGGQKKRVTLGEMMITQARALFLDEISTGLDSAATFDIVSALKRWTRIMKGSATIALLQPSPEVFQMFDNIILLRQGVIVFSGTHQQLRTHFNTIKIEPNSTIDFADWLVEFLTDPPAVWQRDIETKGKQSSMASFRTSFKEFTPNDGQTQEQALNPSTSIPGQSYQKKEEEQIQTKQNLQPRMSLSSAHEVTFHVGPDVDVEELYADGNNTTTVKKSPVLSGDVVVSRPTPAAGTVTQPTRTKGLGQIVTAKGIPLTTSALRKAYEASSTYTDMLQEVSDANNSLEKKAIQTDPTKLSEFTRTQFYSLQSRSLWHHTKTCLDRQYMFMTRSPEFIFPRIGQSVFMGLVMGSLFYQLGIGTSDFSPRIGLILYGLIFIAFINLAEVPLASEFKLVVYKQVDAGFYSTFSYVAAVVIMHLPLAVLESTIFATLTYWMADFTHDAGRYFFFVFIMICVNLAIGVLFRTVAYLSKNPDIAMNLTPPITAVWLLFGGFLITKDKIPDWLIWMYYLSPFSWGLRSGALNEFQSDRYENGLGDSYLSVWQISHDTSYKWAGIGYLICLFFVMIIISSAALKYKRSWLTLGTRRTDTDTDIDIIEQQQQEEVKIEVRIGGTRTTSMIQAAAAAAAEQQQQQLQDHDNTNEPNEIKFQQMDLSWIDLKYSVEVIDKDITTGKETKRQRQLLGGINGFARAGELTALMGSSGAGKTTLMDVLAGRKTSGKITGEILIDGHQQTFPTFNRLMGYCEQTDIHVGTQTVREAIEFSAQLRLSSTISKEARTHFIDQILEDLELDSLSGRLIGDANIEGLSPNELKRLSIAVELAANPTFLFLDEPTSGLDSRAALIVCRVIRKIARRGRAVVCTIHQPSAELFSMFDRLLLLKSGGKEVYFGPVGEDGYDLVSYFMNANIGPEYYRPSLPERVNPASWMLDVIGAGTSAKGKIAPYDEVYAASKLREDNMNAVRALSTPKDGKSAPRFDSPYASSYGQQFYSVVYRLFAVYWRDTSYNSAKFTIMMILGVIFGLVWRDINDNDEAGLISKVSAIYMTTGFMGVLQTTLSLPIIFRLREVFYRERAANTYAPVIYSASLAIVELPYALICVFLYVIPLYFLVHFEYRATPFFNYIGVVYLFAIFFSYFGQFIATTAPNIQVANILCGLIFTFLFLFSGIFIQKEAIPAGWQWVYYMNPFPKALLPNSIFQFYCDNSDGHCPTIHSVTYGDIQLTKWEWVSKFLSTGKDWENYYLAWLIFSIVVLWFVVALAIQKVSHLKR